MELIGKIVQVALALGVVNVWILRVGKSTAWRGGSALTLKEEFKVYGLPEWFFNLVRVLKLTCASLLVAGLWFPVVTRPAAIGLGVLMLGAVAMHVKVNDPLRKAIPALTCAVLSFFVAAI